MYEFIKLILYSLFVVFLPSNHVWHKYFSISEAFCKWTNLSFKTPCYPDRQKTKLRWNTCSRYWFQFIQTFFSVMLLIFLNVVSYPKHYHIIYFLSNCFHRIVEYFTLKVFITHHTVAYHKDAVLNFHQNRDCMLITQHYSDGF